MNLPNIHRVTDLLTPDNFVGATALFALFVVVGLVLTRLFGALMRRVLEQDEDSHIDRMSMLFASQFGKLFIWAVVFTFYAHLIPSLNRLGTALLAGVSIVSIVIGMAAQTTLGNLIAGVSLLLYRPFTIGDRLQVNTPTGLETGTVETVSLGYTVIRTYDNRRIVMSNSSISNQVMINLTSVDVRVMAVITVSISYGDDIDRARAIILEQAHQHPQSAEVVSCPVTNLGTSSVDFTLRIWCADSGVAYQLKTELLEQIKKRFDAEGIEIPFAYTNVVLKRES